MTKYGKSPWIDQYPTARVPAYPRQRGAITTDAVIVGGGLTGCVTAYAFGAAGVKVALVEAERIGRGSTGSAVGWIAEDPGTSFVAVEKALGVRAARSMFQAWHRAALDFAALLRRLDVKCHLQPLDTWDVAITPEQILALEREQTARRAAGLAAPFVNARAVKSALAIEGAGGVRYKSDGVLDPYRACLGIAAAAAARGANVFERSAVKRITFGRKTVDVFTGGGTIRASRVILATGAPTALCQSLERHFWYRSSYLALTDPLPAKLRQRLGRGDSVVRDGAVPPHLLRWVNSERLLISGTDAGSPTPAQHAKVTVQRTGQLMYELSTLYPDISGIRPAFGWAAAYARTVDGLPYIGPHRNFPRHLFAFGDASRSVTGAYLASRILLRHHLEEPDPTDAPYEFTRYGR
jgi:glycine/D-amino acid oxidase-like deaminating enzyme